MAITINGNGTINGCSGMVLQAQSVTYRGYQSYTMDNANGINNYGLGNAGFDATVLDLTITPRSTSSKILLMANISISHHGNNYGVMRLKRGIGGATPTWSTAGTDWMPGTSGLTGNQHHIGTHSATILNGEQHSLKKIDVTYLDSPSTTSQILYRFNFKLETDGPSTTMYLNRTYYQNNDYGGSTAVSTVTALEIAG